MDERIKRYHERFPLRNRSLRVKRRCLVFGILLTCVAALMTVFPPATLRYLDGRFYDIMLQSLSSGHFHSLPVIVTIDDPSLEKYGQWPWSRFRLASLVQKIIDLGASGAGLDLILAEPDRCSLSGILDELERETGHRFQTDLSGFPDSNLFLAQTVHGSPVALGYKFLFRSTDTESKEQWLHPLPNAVLRELPGYPSRPLKANDVLCNIPSLSRSASASGFINAGADPDGVLRRVPLIGQYRGGLYPDLALACLMLKDGIPKISITSGQDGLLMRWNNKKIPLDSRGNLLLRYRGKRGTFPYYSAADILDDRLPPGALKNKVVFVGATASGLGDWYVSPLDTRFPGPEVHATIVDNIMSGDFLYRPGWANGAELFSVILLGVILSLAMAYGNPAAGLALFGITAVSVGYAFHGLFHTWGMYLSPLMPLATLLILFSGISILNYGYAEQKARRQTKALLHAQDTTIIRLATLAEARDHQTGLHLQRTQRYVRSLARELSRHPRYGRQVVETGVELFSKCAPLHDIGKVGIPDHILLKQGELTDDEFSVMKDHTLIGARVLSGTLDGSGPQKDNTYLGLARDMAVSHHEKWDGTGYPLGLKGANIPLAGRIMALADVYDALTTKRTYKQAFLHQKARELIISEKGKHFDPVVVEAFLAVEDTFKAIAREFGEDGQASPPFQS
jgi:CHASE2 domain-containing sensor protein